MSRNDELDAAIRRHPASGTTPDTAGTVALLQTLAARIAAERPHRRADEPAYRDGWGDAQRLAASYIYSALLAIEADLELPRPRPATGPPCLTVVEPGGPR